MQCVERLAPRGSHCAERASKHSRYTVDRMHLHASRRHIEAMTRSKCLCNLLAQQRLRPQGRRRSCSRHVRQDADKRSVPCLAEKVVHCHNVRCVRRERCMATAQRECVARLRQGCVRLTRGNALRNPLSTAETSAQRRRCFPSDARAARRCRSQGVEALQGVAAELTRHDAVAGTGQQAGTVWVAGPRTARCMLGLGVQEHGSIGVPQPQAQTRRSACGSPRLLGPQSGVAPPFPRHRPCLTSTTPHPQRTTHALPLRSAPLHAPRPHQWCSPRSPRCWRTCAPASPAMRSGAACAVSGASLAPRTGRG